jgi:large subunit ribosomal protein L28
MFLWMLELGIWSFVGISPETTRKIRKLLLVLESVADILCGLLTKEIFMARICEITGKGPRKGSIIWRSGKSKKSGGIGTHITAITKRKFHVNLQRVKALMPNGEVRYVRVAASAIKKGLVAKAPRRTWKKEDAKKA